MTFVYNFSKQETLAGLSKNSIAISDFTSEILCSDLALHNQEATALLFYNNLKLTADASGSNMDIKRKSLFIKVSDFLQR